MPGRRLVLLASFLLLTAGTSAFAQAILERVVGPGQNGQPLRLGGFVQSVIGDMSDSTEVPMGLEMAMQPHIITVKAPPVLTGLTLRTALNVLIEAVPEYEWHTADGVVVIRPRGAASIEAHPLHQTVGALEAPDLVAQQVASVGCAWLGTPAVMRLSDRQRFSMSFARGPLIDLLNEAVRQHGSLVWTFHHATGGSAKVFLSFMSAGNGRGCGAPGQPKAEGVDVALQLSRTAVPPVPINPLDARLPYRQGSPHVFFGFTLDAIRNLVTAVRVPIGFESGPQPAHITKHGVPFRGDRLVDVLDALTAADPTYEWRVLEGVVVIRPVTAWTDPANPLARRVEAMRFLNEPIGKVLRAALAAAGQTVHNTFPDSKRLWLDAPPGTALDLLNAVVRAHGGLYWTLAPPDPDPAVTVPMRPRILFQWPLD